MPDENFAPTEGWIVVVRGSFPLWITFRVTRSDSIGAYEHQFEANYANASQNGTAKCVRAVIVPPQKVH